MFSSELSADEKRIVTEWILSNPHAALELVIATHRQRWYGCQCCIQVEVDKRKRSGANVLDITKPEECAKVF